MEKVCIVEMRKKIGYPAKLTKLRKLSKVRNLPTLPHILLKLMEACSGENADVAKISRIVEADPSLSSRILKLINSAYYGLPNKIESINHSVNCLGIDTVRNIAIGSSISQSFRPPKVGTLFNLKVFWWHSLVCAVLARLIAKEARYPNPDEAFLAGLLHDIGRLVLWINYPEEYSELLEKYRNHSDLLLAGEARQGSTHCEISAWLLQEWGFSSFVIDAVLYHHEPMEKVKNTLPLVQILYLANILAIKSVQKDTEQELGSLAKELLNLSPTQVKDLLSKTVAEVGDVAEMMEIEIEEPHETDTSVSEQDRKKLEVLNKEVNGFIAAAGQATFQDLLEARGEDEILGAVQRGIETLFDTKDVFFFLYDHERKCLIGKGVKGNERSMMISGLAVSMEIKKSALVASLLQDKDLELFIDSSGPETVLIDRQIIRFIGKEGILCLPMLAHREDVGVIVLGIDKIEFAHLSEQFNLLDFFSKHAALSLYKERKSRN
jgi:HD-like signal output (HDOD) protein